MKKSPVIRKSLTIAGALLALAAFASTADARMGGMSGMGMSSSMSHGDMRGSTSPSLGSPHGIGSDTRNFHPGGRFEPGLETRIKGSHWKRPIDSDQGGDGDPPKKPPKGSTQTGENEDPSKGWTHHGPYSDKGYWDRWGHHHGPWPK